MNPTENYIALKDGKDPYDMVVYWLECLLTFSLLAIVERGKLYLGSDHLLVVRYRFFQQTAHRYYYRDIEAFTVRKTGGTTVVTVLLVVVLLVFLSLLVLVRPASLPLSSDAMLVAVAVLLGLGIIRNVLLGPACITELHTETGKERLISLSRYRTALRVVKQMAHQIRQEQGELSPDILEQHIQAQEVPAIYTAAHTHAAGLAQGKTGPRKESGRVHMILSFLFCYAALSAAADIYIYSQIKNLFDCLFFVAMLTLGCMAAARQRRSDIPQDLQKLVLFSLIYSVISFYIIQVLVSFTGAFTPAFMDAPSLLSNRNPMFQVLFATQFVVYTVLGIVGMVRSFSVMKQSKPAVMSEAAGYSE